MEITIPQSHFIDQTSVKIKGNNNNDIFQGGV